MKGGWKAHFRALQVAGAGYIGRMSKARSIFLAILVAVVFGGGLWLGIKLPGIVHFGSNIHSYSTASLLQQVQTLSRLVTVKYVIERVEVTEDVKWYGENRVLLLAHGIVQAGIDLSRIQPKDIQATDRKVTIHLPPAQIMDAFLDDKQTKVIDRTTGLFRTFDKGLEQTTRENAVDDIQRAARTSGILDDAKERARTQLINLFRQLGFTQIEFR